MKACPKPIRMQTTCFVSGKTTCQGNVNKNFDCAIVCVFSSNVKQTVHGKAIATKQYRNTRLAPSFSDKSQLKHIVRNANAQQRHKCLFTGVRKRSIAGVKLKRFQSPFFEWSFTKRVLVNGFCYGAFGIGSRDVLTRLPFRMRV